MKSKFALLLSITGILLGGCSSLENPFHRSSSSSLLSETSSSIESQSKEEPITSSSSSSSSSKTSQSSTKTMESQTDSTQTQTLETSEETSFSSESESQSSEEEESFDLEGYSFTGISEGSYEYPDQSLEENSRTPFSTSFEESDESYESFDLSPLEDSYESYPEENTSIDPPPSENEPEEPTGVNPSNVAYAVTDLSSNKSVNDLKLIADSGYYANLAISLAENEIAQMGMETFRAFAIIFDGDTEEVTDYLPGIAFTNNNVYEVTEEGVLFSCGFMQITQKGEETPLILTEDIAKNGIPVIPAEDNGKRYVIESNTMIDGFSGKYDEHFFSYRQVSPFVIEVDAHPANGSIETWADEELDLYDFNEGKYLYKASLFNGEIDKSAYALYGRDAVEAYEKAMAILDEGIRIQEETGVRISLSNFVFVSEDLLNSLYLSEQRQTANNVLIDYINAVNLEENQYLMLDSDGSMSIGVDYNYSAARQNELLGGLLKTMTSMLLLKHGFAVIIAIGGAVNPVIGAIMFVAAFGEIMYATSEMIEGVQQIYRGATGLETDEPALNPIRDMFVVLTGDEKTGSSLYYAAGLISTLSSSIFGAVNTTLAGSALLAGGASISASVISIARVTVVTLFKMAISAGAATYVGSFVKKIALNSGLSPEISRLLSFGATIITGLLVYKGLDTLDRAFNLSGLSRFTPTKSDYENKNTSSSESGGSSGSDIKPIKNPKNDIDISDGVNSNYMDRNIYSKNSWVKQIYQKGYYEQGIKTSLHVKTYNSSGVAEYTFGPMMAKDPAKANARSLVGGYYDHSTKTIYIDMDVVENDGLLTLRTMAHLLRHVYQFEHAEWNSPVMKSLRSGFYIPPDVSYYGYRQLAAEVDAENYADYIVDRAVAADLALNENPDLEEFISEVEFPDPITFLEA